MIEIDDQFDSLQETETNISKHKKKMSIIPFNSVVVGAFNYEIIPCFS